MRQGLISIKSLLFKWAVVYIVLSLFAANAVLNTVTFFGDNSSLLFSTASFGNSSSPKPTAVTAPTGPKPTRLPPYDTEIDPSKPGSTPPSTPRVARGGSGGNSYAAGNCTWYAKSKRPDLPNNLGNANTWASRAASQGIPTGSTPQLGAVGQQGMHVVYVERVNPDGTVFISEMNKIGYGKISTRTVPASSFKYIY